MVSVCEHEPFGSRVGYRRQRSGHADICEGGTDFFQQAVWHSASFGPLVLSLSHLFAVARWWRCGILRFVHHGVVPLLLLDQDGVLADFDGGVHRALLVAGFDPALIERTCWETFDDVHRSLGPEAAVEANRARHAPGFFRDLGVVQGAVEAVEQLMAAGCEVVVCTAPSLRHPNCASEKLAWLAEHFPALRKRFAVVKDKTLVRGDVLVDDKPSVTGALTPLWRHVRFATPGNAHVMAGPLLSGWHDWQRLVRFANGLDELLPDPGAAHPEAGVIGDPADVRTIEG